MGNTSTDQNGNFSFQSNDFVKGFKYLVIEAATPYYCIGGVSAELQNTNSLEIKCETSSNIIYRFINTNFVDQNDQLSNIYIDRPFGPQWVVSSTQTFNGMAVDETLATGFRGYTSNVLHYTVRKNSITQNYTDTILTPDPFASTTICDTIRY